MVARARRSVIAGMVVVASLLLPATGPAPGRASSTQIAIGAVVDLTGSAGVYGESLRNGMRLAADQINAAGGINGHRMSLLVVDGATKTSTVVGLYRRFIANRYVLALIAPTLSQEAFNADPVAQAAGLPVVGPITAAPGITAIGTYIFRVSIGDDVVVPQTLAVTAAHVHLRRVALIYGTDDAYTRGSGTAFKATVARMGIHLADVETFTTHSTVFTAKLTRIRDAHPDAVLVAALYRQAVQILRQGRQVGIPAGVHFIGGTSLNTPELLTGAGPAAEGVVASTQWSSQIRTAPNRRFMAAYRARYGHDPDRFAAQAYDSVSIVAAAVRRAGTTGDRAAVRAALATIKDVPVVTGTTGTFSFTAAREPDEQGQVQIVKHGRFVEYR
jgi:branched-chain amino acid transport system substrate-binding protein